MEKTDFHKHRREILKKVIPQASNIPTPTVPAWFPRAWHIAQHRDTINRWPKWQRFAHWLLVSWRCPGCQAYREDLRALRRKLKLS